MVPPPTGRSWTADVRAAQGRGSLLPRNHRIHVAAAARAALARGEVDPRLLVTLAALAAIHPLDIAGFSVALAA